MPWLFTQQILQLFYGELSNRISFAAILVVEDVVSAAGYFDPKLPMRPELLITYLSAGIISRMIFLEVEPTY
ncbi:hypothetical protein BN1080_00401 [Planococcus massiliensis]|uniref:Uncharacterized protein n=1 Tax=Planococcus massiliensis TaxID=1499687 RepID=A0A098EI64_9BACL|nr:hypothetical protein [Planococcus massiliensis]CEG21490.1 hypothetical protein BN1080_00401 [Planococcus massiliensis]